MLWARYFVAQIDNQEIELVVRATITFYETTPGTEAAEGSAGIEFSGPLDFRLPDHCPQQIGLFHHIPE